MKSRGLISTLTVIALLSLLATCSLDTGLRPASGTELPADQVLDVARSYSGPFTYETLLPVALNLTVQLYQQPSPAAALARQTSDSQLIVVSLRNSKGETLYSGPLPSGGTLATVLSLPAAPQDVVLRLDAPGYEPREVTIDGMVLYSEINRVMGLLSEGLSAKGDLPDTDLDGVPDIYDVDPLDPEVAFQVRTPASGQFTVAFEDLYPVPGDADYNDFAAKYFLLENHKSEIPAEEVLEVVEGPKSRPIEVMLFNLCGEATATAKIAGYSHKFGIVIDFPGLVSPRVTREYYDAYGTRRIDTQDNVADRAVVWLYENTSKNVVGKTARFEICFPKGTTREMVSIAPYDPVLYVLNTKQEIHMVGQDPLAGTTAALAAELSYMDPNGYPWALLVPEDWQHPAETQYIGKAYPLFDEWRASKGATAPYWYLYPTSIGTKPGNLAPSQVSSPDSPQMTAGSASQQLFHLLSTDPEGDKVTFLSSPAPMALEGFFSLDGEKGEVRFAPQAPEGDFLFYFWSVDSWGASNIDKPLKVTFQFRKMTSENLPPTASFPPTGFQVLGNVDNPANGYYVANGTFPSVNPQTKYTQMGGNYNIYSFYFNDDFMRYWAIHNSLIEVVADLNTLAYYFYDQAQTNLSQPPETGWAVGTGATPLPGVLRMPISGEATVGKPLTIHYQFSDPDEDAEGATRFQWYNGTSLIQNAIAAQYTPTGTGTYSVQVTPVDIHGLAGATVTSDALSIQNAR